MNQVSDRAARQAACVVSVWHRTLLTTMDAPEVRGMMRSYNARRPTTLRLAKLDGQVPELSERDLPSDACVVLLNSIVFPSRQWIDPIHELLLVVREATLVDEWYATRGVSPARYVLDRKVRVDMEARASLQAFALAWALGHQELSTKSSNRPDAKPRIAPYGVELDEDDQKAIDEKIEKGLADLFEGKIQEGPALSAMFSLQRNEPSALDSFAVDKILAHNPSSLRKKSD